MWKVCIEWASTNTQAGNAKLLGERNSPCHRGKKSTYCYITDNILAQERRAGAHFGDFISF